MVLAFDDSFDGTLPDAGTAVDAGVRVDGVLRVALGNSFDRAGVRTGSAHRASISNYIRHSFFLMLWLSETA